MACMAETTASSSRYIQKLQRAIVDALDDVKGQDIKIFNTEAITPLFERVVIASGTSSRQTRALAAHVRDQVVAMGGDKPRMEGQDNGEWIVVDCGAAVVHIMHPAVRQYYRLEDIWGDKPVRLRRATPVRR
jgi:ribosome-associated protein